jgi:hypothetical protein
MVWAFGESADLAKTLGVERFKPADAIVAIVVVRV